MLSLRVLLPAGVFLVTGWSSLALQLVWTRWFATALGHEMPALLGVLSAVLCGAAVGAVGLDRRISRSPRPDLWLGGLALLSGTWAGVVTWLIPPATAFAQTFLGSEASAGRAALGAFVLPLILLLPATGAMGAAWPAADRWISWAFVGDRSVGALYALSNLGGAFGVVVCVGWLLPGYGLRVAATVLTLLQLAAGFATLVCVASTKRSREDSGASAASSGLDLVSGAVGQAYRWVATAFATGLLGIAYEVAGVRVLAQSLDGTVYSYAAVLVNYLIGATLGASAYQCWGRSGNPTRTLGVLLALTTLACFVGILALRASPAILRWAESIALPLPFPALWSEWITAATAFLLPSASMAATFSHLAQSTRGRAGGIGLISGVNTLGGALAPALYGALLLPRLGMKGVLVLLVSGYAILALWHHRRRWVLAIGVGVVGATASLGWSSVRLPAGGQVIAVHEGLLGSAAVVAEPDGHRTLRLDHRFQMGGTAAAEAQRRQAHLPLLLHAQPRRALFLGLGTGITMGAGTLHPELRGDGVELVPEVVDLLDYFRAENRGLKTQPMARVYAADARRYVSATPERYDVIVGDLFHPARDGAALLYSREHFAAVRRCLRPGGLFCQWLPLHQLDDRSLRSVARTFLEVFPRAQAWLLRYSADVPVVGLVGYGDEVPTAFVPLEERRLPETLREELKVLQWHESLRFLGQYLAGPAQLRRFVDDAPINLDDRPWVAFHAPRYAAAAEQDPAGRLARLLTFAAIDDADLPPEIAGLESGSRRRLLRYLGARNTYLQGLIAEAAEKIEAALEHFIASARLSEDFTAGYARCLSLVNLRAAQDPAFARRVLERLAEAQPNVPVARELLRRGFTNPSP